jgi:hypothetical protein
MGALTTFLKVLKGAVSISPSAKKLETVGVPPIEASLWTPSCKVEANVHLNTSTFQFILRGVELWANHVE